MRNIIGYLETMKERSFQDTAFSAVDSLVLSQLSYLRLELFFPSVCTERIGRAGSAPVITGTDLQSVCSQSSLYRGLCHRGSFRRFLSAFLSCKRFASMELRYFVSETDPVTEKQFCAMSFCFDGDFAQVTFRGTDATIVGWKEDFNMAFISPVPSQRAAQDYLDAIAEFLPQTLYIGGHSKGGNLAVYASMKCRQEIQERICRIYSHDGPGFQAEVFDLPEYHRIQDRIHKYIPQSSIVGMILERQETGLVIESRQIGFLQHDPFSWVVRQEDFVSISSVKNTALLLDKGLNDWIMRMSVTERELFVDSLFHILYSSGAATLWELIGNWKNIINTLEAVKDLDRETRTAGLKLTRDLLSIISDYFKEYRLERYAKLRPFQKKKTN